MILSILATLCVLGTILLFHELGHFLAAKKVRMRVQEFSIGAGRPILFSWKRGETVYNLRPFLFMGFVRLAGLEMEDEEEEKNTGDGFYDRTPGQRIFVLAAGAAMNLLLAVLLFWIEGLTFGLPVKSSPRLAQVVANSPADRAGLRPGDRLLGIGDQRSDEVQVLQRIIQTHPGQPLTVHFLRDGVERTVTVTPQAVRQGEQTIGRLGIGFSLEREKLGFTASIRMGALHTYREVVRTVTYLALMGLRQLPFEIGGPVMIVQGISAAARSGPADLLDYAAMLSIGIGLLNILIPLPGLDCGRLLFALVEGITGKPIDRRFEASANAVGIFLLLAFIAGLTIKELGQVLGTG
jgi:regulator of sigma E protease